MRKEEALDVCPRAFSASVARFLKNQKERPEK